MLSYSVGIVVVETKARDSLGSQVLSLIKEIKHWTLAGGDKENGLQESIGRTLGLTSMIMSEFVETTLYLDHLLNSLRTTV